MDVERHGSNMVQHEGEQHPNKNEETVFAWHSQLVMFSQVVKYHFSYIYQYLSV